MDYTYYDPWDDDFTPVFEPLNSKPVVIIDESKYDALMARLAALEQAARPQAIERVPDGVYKLNERVSIKIKDGRVDNRSRDNRYLLAIINLPDGWQLMRPADRGAEGA